MARHLLEQYCETVRQLGATALISMGLEKGRFRCHHRRQLSGMGVQPTWRPSARGASVGVYATNAWPQVEYVINIRTRAFFSWKTRSSWTNGFDFREKVPRLKKVIVWDTEGLRISRTPGDHLRRVSGTGRGKDGAKIARNGSSSAASNRFPRGSWRC
jgi:hypothetical protein